MIGFLSEDYICAGNTIISYDGKLSRLTVPSRFRGARFKELGRGAFMNNKIIEYIELEQGIEKINRQCFDGCSKLKKIIIPRSISFVAEDAFRDCKSLEVITFKNALKPGELEGICEGTWKIGSGKYLLTDYGENNQLVRKIGDYVVEGLRFPAAFPKEADGIYYIYNGNDFMYFSDEDKNNGRVPDNHMPYDDYVPGLIKSEEYNFQRLIRNYNGKMKNELSGPVVHHIDSDECSNISGIVFSITPSYPKGAFDLNVRLLKGEFFCQTYLKIRHRGNDFFLYRRAFLSRDKSRPYEIIDRNFLLDGSGDYCDGEMLAEVGAKYRMIDGL